MANVNKNKLLLERTFGAPPLFCIFYYLFIIIYVYDH